MKREKAQDRDRTNRGIKMKNDWMMKAMMKVVFLTSAWMNVFILKE